MKGCMRRFRFYDGYANHIENVSVIGKISAKTVDKDRGSVWTVLL